MLESSMGFACNDSHVFNASAAFLRGEMQALEAQHNRRVKRGECIWRSAARVAIHSCRSHLLRAAISRPTAQEG